VSRTNDTGIRHSRSTGRLLRRAVAAAALVASVLLLSGPSWSASTSAPVITLLTPANGATVYSSTTTTSYPTFTWRINWDTPEDTTVLFEAAADPSFTQNAETDTHFCPATNVSCWTSFQPHKVWGPPYGSVWFWRVGLTTSAGIVYSPTFQFTAKNPPPVADHTKPRVKVYPGWARRGQRAFIKARIGDNSGTARLRVTLSWNGHIALYGNFGWRPVIWDLPRTFISRDPVPRYLPTGRYSACVKAWDKAGNHASSCAPYRIR
jgi:hypothetical protein